MPGDRSKRSITERVIAVLRNLPHMDPEEISVAEDTLLVRDLEMDSEDGIELACVLEDEFQINIPNEVNPLEKAKTVGKLVKWIEQLVENREVISNG